MVTLDTLTVEASTTEHGQVTIPAEVRTRLGLRPRGRVVFELEGDEVKLRAASSAVLDSYGAVTPRTRPEDYDDLRERFEQGVADDVMSESE